MHNVAINEVIVMSSRILQFPKGQKLGEGQINPIPEVRSLHRQKMGVLDKSDQFFGKTTIGNH